MAIFQTTLSFEWLYNKSSRQRTAGKNNWLIIVIIHHGNYYQVDPVSVETCSSLKPPLILLVHY